MNRKYYPFILVLVLALILLLVKLPGKNQGDDKKEPDHPRPETVVNRDRGFDRRKDFLEYSKHAKCRMECRNISPEEVEEIMGKGKINYAKSDLKNARCPRYAIEGITSDRQDVRIIFAQCNEKTIVVTVIDLDTEFECHCPGDK